MTEEWESAFPIPDGPAYQSSFGLTKREYFAALAMTGMLANSARSGSVEDGVEIAVIFADALIAQLNKPVTP